MTDERFTFIEDCKDKKRTARGAFNKRTHCGKGGAVMFPSDYLTNKEKKAMNGACKTYRMNDPMTWKDFKYMPQDLQCTYIHSLRDTFGANNKVLFAMLGISDAAGSKYFAKIGLGLGRGKTPGKFNEEAWKRWLNGEVIIPEDNVIKQVTDPDEFMALLNGQDEPTDANVNDLPSSVSYIRIPQYADDCRAELCSGRLTFEGNAYDIAEKFLRIIGNANVHMSISWEVIKEED